MNDLFETTDANGATRLRLARLSPPDNGKILLTVLSRTGGAHESVVLRPAYLRPLAAWMAGEAQPGIVGHDEYGMPYGRWLSVAGDRTAVVYGTHSVAQMECAAPYGAARVALGPRRGSGTLAVRLLPEARTDLAAWLRRADAQGWARQSTAV